ncbi:MAG TPA: ABC transporter permease subunit [Fimbriiglobus sp.]|nr:ABC transporter permease subunit [Fimbriiglobus sp.]
MDVTAIALIMGKEVREARQNRWFLVFAVIFAGLALGLSLLGMSGLGNVGIAGFGRTAASLLNLVMVVVPLMALLVGATSVVGEREQGTLQTLLAQPVVLEEVLLGKFLGLATALLATVLAGFGLSALVIAYHGGGAQVGSYALLVGTTCLFALSYLSVGYLVSTLVRKVPTALGIGLFLWLASVLLSDLGLMGTAVVLELSPRTLLWLSLANPAQVYKLLVLDGLQGNLETLGPAGLYAADVLGNWLRPVLAAILSAWAVLPLGAVLVLFRRRGMS